jgi:hypothetical protein
VIPDQHQLVAPSHDRLEQVWVDALAGFVDDGLAERDSLESTATDAPGRRQDDVRTLDHMRLRQPQLGVLLGLRPRSELLDVGIRTLNRLRKNPDRLQPCVGDPQRDKVNRGIRVRNNQNLLTLPHK